MTARSRLGLDLRAGFVRASLSLLALALPGPGCGGGDSPVPDSGGAIDGAVTPPDAKIDPPDASPPDATPVSWDCNNLPLGESECTGGFPNTCFVPMQVSAAIASEDLAFDDLGNLVGSDNHTIFKTSRTGSPELFVPNIDFRAGLRYLPSGDLIVADDETGSLVRIDGDGVRTTILSGLSYPNGLTIDPKGFVYVTEHDAGRVRRVAPETGEFTIIVEPGTIAAPNGIAFNRTFDVLYIDGFDSDTTVYQLPIDADGNPGALTPFATGLGSGMHDGIGVDACGNVYVCDYGFDGDTDILRISADGTKVEMIMRGIPGGGSRYVPNLQWGSGRGGWSRTAIYMPEGWDQRVFEIELGVPSATQIYPPLP
jgi:hypothetical protein